MRALVLGGAGMLGHRLWAELRGRADCYVTVRRSFEEYAPLGLFERERTIERVDAANDDHLDRAFAIARPDVVFNCIGIVKQLDAARDPTLSITINSLLPHRLAATCLASGTRLIQLSTDCVFSGRTGGYTEDELPDPPDLYGRSKLLGEISLPGCTTLRTSMIGREIGTSHGLVEWFLAQREGARQVRGYTRARFSGFTTLELARLLAGIAEGGSGLDGVWHASAEPISKFDLLELVNDAFRCGTRIEPDSTFECDRTLDSSRFRRLTGYVPPSWPAMVEEMAHDPTPYDSWTGAWTSTAST